MRLSKFLKTMLLITALAVIYIYMQNKIFQLAYQGKVREKKIMHLSEINSVLAYEIMRMKSAHHLGDKLLSENSSMRFRDRQSVVQLVASGAEPAGKLQTASVSKSVANPLLNLFSLNSAEAQPSPHEVAFQPWARKH